MNILTRTRTRDERTVGQWSWYDKPSNVTSYHDGNVNGSLATMKDNNNKGFRKTRDSGGIILSDCELSRWERTFTGGTLGNSSTTFSGDIAGFASGGASIVVPNGTIDGMLILVKTFAKLNSSAMMSGELLSDLGATVAMLRSPFKSATTLLTRMVKYRSRHLGKTVKSASLATANTWLEYRYGWQPIILDCKSVIKAVQGKRERCDQLRLVARGGDRTSFMGAGSWGPVLNSDGHVSTVGSCTTSQETKCDVGIIYDLKSQDAFDSFSKLTGSRLRDIPATIWEIIPYSFVIDWFINVGDWLQAVTPVPGLTIRGWWITTTNHSEVTTSARVGWPGTPPIGSLIYTGDMGSWTVKSSSLSRSCNQPLSFTPSLKAKALSSLHQVDAIALLVKPILGQLALFRH